MPETIFRTIGITKVYAFGPVRILALAHRVVRFADGRISEVGTNDRRVEPEQIEW